MQINENTHSEVGGLVLVQTSQPWKLVKTNILWHNKYVLLLCRQFLFERINFAVANEDWLSSFDYNHLRAIYRYEVWFLVIKFSGFCLSDFTPQFRLSFLLTTVFAWSFQRNCSLLLLQVVLDKKRLAKVKFSVFFLSMNYTLFCWFSSVFLHCIPFNIEEVKRFL